MVLSGLPYDYTRLEPLDVRGKKNRRPAHPVVLMIKKVLSFMIDMLELPPNPLDQLVHLCGGRNVVAEMTGRSEMMEVQPDGRFKTVKRADPGVRQQSLNLHVRCSHLAYLCCITGEPFRLCSYSFPQCHQDLLW
jgi:hypothetical protein